jgi:hypothetical protein
VWLALAVGLLWLLFLRTRGPSEVSADALSAARAAGCGDVTTVADSAPGNLHLAPGEPYDYAERPASHGYHDPEPLPADLHVYGEPIPETRAVHNLEHAYVVIYYRPEAEGGVSADAVEGLATLARDQSRVLMAPYPELLEGTALALVAWNTRWECPPAVTPEQAVTIARGFIDAYRGTSIAPEAPRGLLGPWISG